MTEGMPIQIIMYEDRMEIHNPGGIYGRIRVDQPGKVQPDTRNPVLASSLEVLGVTENRYSGIPTIKKEMKKYKLREPEFLDERGNFIVKFYKETIPVEVEEKYDDAIQTHVMPLVESGKNHQKQKIHRTREITIQQ